MKGWPAHVRIREQVWLLNTKTLKLEAFYGEQKPEYAVLSHRWRPPEATFGQVDQKIRDCCRIALQDGLTYVWIDTTCIDKSSSSELQEAINSMYKWYRQAEVCYAYLYDVVCDPQDDPDTIDVETSEWFTRGWTLQELLAPRKLRFFDQYWVELGTKASRWSEIQHRTGTPKEALLNYRPRLYSVADIFCWAAYRQTSRPEDRAYSLLGLFDVAIPLLYSEGERAMSRLLAELKRIDHDSLLSGGRDHGATLSKASSGGYLTPSIDPGQRSIISTHVQPFDIEASSLFPDYRQEQSSFAGEKSITRNTSQSLPFSANWLSYADHQLYSSNQSPCLSPSSPSNPYNLHVHYHAQQRRRSPPRPRPPPSPYG